MFSLNRLSTLLIIVTLGLVGFFALPWPSRTLTIAGQDLSISAKLVIAAAVLGLVATGTQALASPEQCEGPWYAPWLSGLWILPTMVSAAALAVLNQTHTMSAQLFVCSATVATLVVLIPAERCSVDSHARLRLASRTIVQVAAFSLMTLLMTAVRMEQVSGVLLGSVAGVCGAAVTYMMLSRDLMSSWRMVLFTAASGLAVGIVAWMVAPLTKTPAAFALSVTVVLYLSVGLLQGYLRGQLRRRVAIEYLLVAVIGLVVVMAFGR